MRRETAGSYGGSHTGLSDVSDMNARPLGKKWQDHVDLSLQVLDAGWILSILTG